MGAAEKVDHELNDVGKLVSLLERLEQRLNQEQTAIEPGEWVLPIIITRMYGINEPSIKKYRYDGTWLEGRHWKWGPQKRIVYNPNAINGWMRGEG